MFCCWCSLPTSSLRVHPTPAFPPFFFSTPPTSSTSTLLSDFFCAFCLHCHYTTALMWQLILITASFVGLFVLRRLPVLPPLPLSPPFLLVVWRHGPTNRPTYWLIVAAFGYIYNRQIDTNRKWCFQANLTHRIGQPGSLPTSRLMAATPHLLLQCAFATAEFVDDDNAPRYWYCSPFSPTMSPC